MTLRKSVSRTGLGLFFRARHLPFQEHRDLLEASQHWSSDRLEELRRRRLRTVLDAASALPFYRDLHDGTHASGTGVSGPEDLPRLPMLEKSALRALHAGISPADAFERTTAGTSGLPTVILADPGAQAAALAARSRCYAWYGIEPGDREARFWGRPIQRPTLRSALKIQLLNREPFDYRDVDGDAVLEACRRLDRSGAAYLYGYASLILRLCRGLERTGRRLRSAPKAAILTAEATTASERQWMGEILGCPVVDEYGCSEVDIIAFACPHGRRHVMAENVVVETVPVDGGMGLQEIVVTDLNNVAMPLIRYRLGDLVTLGQEACPCGRTLPVLATVDGRSTRQYVRTPDGRSVHANPFPYFMEEQQGEGAPLRRFQIRQTALDRLEVFLVLDDGADWAEPLERKLKALVTKYYGHEMVLILHLVDDIRPVPGAKFEYFIALPDEPQPGS